MTFNIMSEINIFFRYNFENVQEFLESDSPKIITVVQVHLIIFANL